MLQKLRTWLLDKNNLIYFKSRFSRIIIVTIKIIKPDTFKYILRAANEFHVLCQRLVNLGRKMQTHFYNNQRLIAMSQEQDLLGLEKKFDELKTEDNKIKGNLVLSALKPFFQAMNDTDFEGVFSIYVAQLSLKDLDRLISLEQLKYIYLGMQDQFSKVRQRSLIGSFYFQSHVALKKSKLVYTNVPSLVNQPIFQIFNKQLTEIIPYEIIFFDSLYKRDEKPSNKTPEKLNEQSLDEPFVCYDFKIYEALLQSYEGPQMNKMERFFYYTIDFRWIEALLILKNEILVEEKYRQGVFLIPTFENLRYIQEEINKNSQWLKPIFQKRKVLAYPNLENFPREAAKKVNEIRNLLDFLCSYCGKIYKQLSVPYLRAVCYFLGKKSQPGSKFQQICNNQSLGTMIKFLFARRFLDGRNFQDYYMNFQNQTKENPKLEHIMFLKNKSDVVQTLSTYWDNHPTELEKVALTCGVVIHKLGKGFNREYLFLEQMIRLYQELLKTIKEKQIHKEYMVKMMAVRSSKQPIWEDLIVKPQFRLNCEPRNDDCVFLSMLEKFLYGGDQKWNKLKTKSSVASDPSKKHYEVEAKHCPYCNYPTPRCSICLEQIKIFTVKSYLNQEIKRKMQKQQKPYMKLNESFDEALIWCPSCAHGGHFGHLSVWFKQNKNCPVDQCQCKCQY